MKKIKIENYENPKPLSIYTKDKYYWVWLGNETKHRFSNRKHAEAFLVRTNRFLNERLFELNRLYVEIFTEYRRLWFYFDRKAMESNIQIEGTLEWINKKFNIVIDRSQGINGNFNVFQNMLIIVDNLKHIIKVLTDLQTQKNNWVERYNLIVISKRLDEIEKTIRNYNLQEHN